jgi:hypothetical protein
VSPLGISCCSVTDPISSGFASKSVASVSQRGTIILS